MRVNAEGAEIVARSAREHEALIVYVSTDYVFDGVKAAPYREEDAPAPLSQYGNSKLEGERRVVDGCPESHLILRTAWLYGPGKGFVDWLRHRLEREESVSLVSDQVGSPTWSREAGEAMLVLVESGERGVFHFVNPGEVSWLDLGRAVAEILGRNEALLTPITARELGRPARRPAYSALSVEKFRKATGRTALGWRKALEEYLQGSAGVT